MTLNLMKNLSKKLSSNYDKLNYLIITRTHINHPGHKPPKKAFVVKRELPDEYDDDLLYPPVKPKFPPAFKTNSSSKSDRLWHYFNEGQNFHSLKTIQERLAVLAYLNIQPTIDEIGCTRLRHYPIFLLNTLPRSANSLEFYQYITKTDITNSNILPKPKGKQVNVDKECYEKIKEGIANCVITNLLNKKKHVDNLWDLYEDKDAYKPEVIEFEESLKKKEERSNEFINDLFNTITTILSSNEQYSYLKNAFYGRNVDIQAYWKRCGYENTKPRGAVYPDPDSIRFQFRDKAILQIKCDMPIKPVQEFNELKETSIKVCDYSPAVYSIFADHTLPMQVPGSWYGDSREFNFLTVYNMTNLAIHERKYGDDVLEQTLKSMIIQTGFAEATAQAYYLGFSMWKDLTYPILTRLIFTNGQDFSFAKYQLNTLNLWNPAETKTNNLYFKPPERLFTLNNDGTQIESINENVLNTLLEILTEKPIENTNEIVNNYSELDYMIGGTALRPYLSIQNFEEQLSIRRKLLAISLYELVKYDMPVTYLNTNVINIPKGEKPRYPHAYNHITYKYRDIVRYYYPIEFQGYELVKRSLKKSEWFKPKYWDLIDPVYEWANVPPPHTNNIKRDINLPKF